MGARVSGRGTGHPKYPDKLEGEVAGCRVHLQLDTRSAPWHEELEGTLFVEGGERLCRVSIHVGIDVYPDQVARGQEILPDRSWNDLEMKPRERVRICFALRMPGSVPLGRMRLCAVIRAGWRHAETLIAEIQVAPPLSFQRLAETVTELTGVPVRSWSTFDLGDGVVATFAPGKESDRPFDALQLELFRNNGVVYGSMIVDPLDRSFADRLRSATGTHEVRIPFRFSEIDLSEAQSFYERSLRQFTDHLRELPIPSASLKPSPAELPVPADAGAPEDLTLHSPNLQFTDAD